MHRWTESGDLVLHGVKPGTFNEGKTHHMYQVVLSPVELRTVIDALANRANDLTVAQMIQGKLPHMLKLVNAAASAPLDSK